MLDINLKSIDIDLGIAFIDTSVSYITFSGKEKQNKYSMSWLKNTKWHYNEKKGALSRRQ